MQVKVAEQYFPVVLFITLCKLARTFDSVDEILKSEYQMKAIEPVNTIFSVPFFDQSGNII